MLLWFFEAGRSPFSGVTVHTVVAWSQIRRSLSENATTVRAVSLLQGSLGSGVEGSGPHVGFTALCSSSFSQRSKAVCKALLLSLYVSVPQPLAVQIARAAIYLKNL